MAPLAATVLIPTSGDRAELVRLSLACILNQTIQDIEVFIIGDGVEGASKETLQAFAEQDSRVHFHDHPKFISGS
ncbi:MAG: glycosyltransferase family 2 protein [Cyanothece sp. SIO1E1]|nr:glycosyltransferase family 2 protein [Cyanothece sp. SIO1E1]